MLFLKKQVKHDSAFLSYEIQFFLSEFDLNIIIYLMKNWFEGVFL